MITGSQTRSRFTFEKKYWLDEMPIDIRQKIAREATARGQRTDAALNLARTSDLQRLAVLASMPQHVRFPIEAMDLSDEWAEVLAGHIQEVSIDATDPHHVTDRDFEDAPLLRLIRAPQLKSAFIPGVTTLLLAIRGPNVLENLGVDIRSCSHRSLLFTLKHVGSRLRKLNLSCTDNKGVKYNTQSRKCPMTLCSPNASSNVTTFCPNLKHLGLDCAHIQPSTTSFLVQHLPSLNSITLFSSLYETIDVSDEDIEALRGLRQVKLQNVFGGLELASRVGSPVEHVNYIQEVGSDTVLQLLNCPRLSSVEVRMEVEGLKSWIHVVPKISKLRSIFVRLARVLDSREIEDATMTARKILRGMHCSDSHVSLMMFFEPKECLAMAACMENISSVFESGSGNITLACYVYGNLILCTIRNGTLCDSERALHDASILALRNAFLE